MLSKVNKTTWIRSGIVSAVFFVIFIVLNFVLSGTGDLTSNSESVTKKEAIQIANTFIEEQTGMHISKSDAIYDANKKYTGYVDKNDATKAHYNNIDNIYPSEKFSVYSILENNELEAKVDINLTTGYITGWSIPLSSQLIIDETSETLAKETLQKYKFPVEGMTFEKQENGMFVAKNTSALSATDAIISVHIKVATVDGKPFVTTYEPQALVPASYLNETAKQDKYAQWYTMGGFVGLSIVMAILAIIYAILYRRHTSFKYGIAFTAIATIISCIAQMSMMKPVLILQEDTLRFDTTFLIVMNIFVFVTVFITAVSHYFSFVAGDGLWKAQGFNLWPRFKEKEFGATVWNSMLLAFLFALSGFGIQAVIFEGLSYLIGTHQGIDPEQSPLNSTMLWFYPLLAWFAAITEEAVYRYFGVGIFRRWFKNTYIAAIIPSLVWAFGHTMYPLYPVSTRIIELVIIGVLLTWVMVKFGLLTVIFTHAMFNTIAMCLSLFYYGESFDIVMGVLYIVMPLVVAYIIKLIHARYMKNRPEPPTKPIDNEPLFNQFPQQPTQL